MLLWRFLISKHSWRTCWFRWTYILRDFNQLFSKDSRFSFLMSHSFWLQKLRFHQLIPYLSLTMATPSPAAGAPSEILDLAAVPRPMQLRVHIVVQVDWFQIAEKFLPRPDEETDICDLTVAVMTTEEELNFYIDMTKQVITNYIWAQFRQNLRKREFCLKLVHPHTAEIVSLNWGWHLAWNASFTKYPIQRRASSNSIVSQLGFYLLTPTGGQMEQSRG